MPIEIGFCDGLGRGFSASVQPSHHVERWQLPRDNGSHLVVDWAPAKSMCGLNVTSYHLDVQTSSPLLNRFVEIFGKMPQDLCSPASVARSSVAIDDAPQGGAASVCSPYETACTAPRQSAVAIPIVLRTLATWDVVVSVRAYGTVAPQGHPTRPGSEKKVEFWCHKVRASLHSPVLTRLASR